MVCEILAAFLSVATNSHQLKTFTMKMRWRRTVHISRPSFPQFLSAPCYVSTQSR